MEEEKEKKKRYTQAQNKATQKYIAANLEEIRFRVKKGEKKKYVAAAAAADMSMTQFFILAADEKIKKEGLL